MRPVRVIIINELEAAKKIPFGMFKVVSGLMESSQKRIYIIKYSIKALLKISLSLSLTHTISYT